MSIPLHQVNTSIIINHNYYYYYYRYKHFEITLLGYIQCDRKVTFTTHLLHSDNVTF